MALTEKDWRFAITTAVLAPVTPNAIAQVAKLVRTVPDPRWIERHKDLTQWFRNNKNAVIEWAAKNNQVTASPAPKLKRGRYGTATHSQRIRRDYAK